MNAVLDDFISAYEAAQSRDGDANLADFLPAADDPHYREVLRELVRVDLEYARQHGAPRPLAEYLERFPDIAEDPASLAEIAFEEYRLRRQAGEEVTPETYQRELGVDIQNWPRASELELRQDRAHRRQGGHGPERLPVENIDPNAATSLWGMSELRRDSVQLMRGLAASDPEAAQVLGQALAALPVGESSFLEFHLLAELGRGAFGRVYLARQGGLADRLVALKVSVDVSGESQTLAQLQHTNIVPIYSLHRAGVFQAVCMPYFGPTTLADVLEVIRKRGVPTSGAGLADILREHSKRFPPAPSLDDDVALPLRTLERLSYVDAVLWIAGRLAEGLDHAHQRGILHRDLKPANVLLTNEGQPMLVDFNLSADTKTDVNTAHCGGTLPYMSPEHLEMFRAGKHAAVGVDVRSDLYALGVILHELLAGKHPFATAAHAPAEAIPTMIAERRAGPAPLRARNPAVSPAVAAIVGRLLEGDPDRRYTSARQVCGDIERQLASQPLLYTREPSLRERCAKWLRRHPRFRSPLGLASVALTLVTAMAALTFWEKYEIERVDKANLQVAQQREVAALQEEAEKSFTDFRASLGLFRQSEDEVAAVRSLLDAGEQKDEVERCKAALAPYHVLEDANWQDAPALRYLPDAQRAQLRRDVSELLFLFARSILFEAAPQGSPEKAKLDLAIRANELARGCHGADDLPRALLMQQARLTGLAGDVAQGEALYQSAEMRQPRTARDAYLTAYEYAALKIYREALTFAQQACQLEPTRPSNWSLLGLCHANLGDPASAVRAFDTCLALEPHALQPVFHRGQAHLELKHWREAHADLNKVVEARPELALAHFYRAAALRGLGEPAKADADLTKALELRPKWCELHFDRARMRELSGNSAGAAADDAEVLKTTPTSAQGWTCKGISAGRLGKKDVALESLKKALELDPRYVPALEEKAAVLASMPGRLQESVATLDEALQVAPRAVSLRLSRGHLLALLGKDAAARADAEACAAQTSDATTLAEAAAIYARTARTYKDRTRALELLAVALRQGYREHGLFHALPFARLQQDPRFRKLVDAARTLDPGGL